MVPKKRISPSVSQARAEISCKTDDTLMPLHLAARSLGTLVDPRGPWALLGDGYILLIMWGTLAVTNNYHLGRVYAYLP
jgi:hypothetical protein